MFVFVVALLVHPVCADLLATYDSSFGGGGLGVFDLSITHRTFLAATPFESVGVGSLFEDIVIYDGDTRVDTVTALDDPDFGLYADLLTDGEDWWLNDAAYFAYPGGSLRAFQLESERLDFADPDHEGVDLAGYTIESVTRTITVDLDSPGSDPNGDGNWTDYEISTLFEIYGHPIPEPATLGLLALSSVALVIRRDRGERNE